MNRAEKMLNWLEKEKVKDRKELEKSKQKFIREILSEKEVIKKPEKLSIWKRLRKVLIGY